MRIRKDNEDHYSMWIEDDERGHHDITIYRYTSMKTMKKSEWTINWSAMGEQDVTTTEKFVNALNEAIRLIKTEEITLMELDK